MGKLISMIRREYSELEQTNIFIFSESRIGFSDDWMNIRMIYKSRYFIME